jgi:hypothetical protein
MDCIRSSDMLLLCFQYFQRQKIHDFLKLDGFIEHALILWKLFNCQKGDKLLPNIGRGVKMVN